MRIIITLWMMLLFAVKPAGAQVKVVKFDTVEKLLHNASDSTLVINFWATWCKPCVKELPYFEQLNRSQPDSKVRVILVSLDFKRELENRVLPFITKNNIRSEVLLLDEPDYNSWIDKVDSSWSGAIPATAIITGGKKIFFEKEFSSYSELEQTIPTLNQKKR